MCLHNYWYVTSHVTLHLVLHVSYTYMLASINNARANYGNA